jgi:hypothetical protein
MFHQIGHEFFAGDMVNVPMHLILNLMRAQRLVNDWIIQRVRRNCCLCNL